MRILFATDIFYPNIAGSGNFAERLALGIQERGHEVLILAPSRRFRSETFHRLSLPVKGLRSVPLFIKKVRFSPPLLLGRTVDKIIESFQPDVIHVQDHFSIGKAAIFSAKKFGIPSMATNHFMPENLMHYLHVPRHAEKWLKQLGWKQFREVLADVRYMTTPTKTAAALLKDIGYTNEVIPISCGIDLERFQPLAAHPAFRKKYHLSEEKPLLLFVGRLDVEKCLPVVVQAFGAALKNIRAHLVIAGKGTEEKKLRSLVENLHLKADVTFTGFVPDDDLPLLYRCADAFVMASIAELQSIATMEAMASGLPVIAANAMALPELVRVKENGFLFEKNSIPELTQCITMLLGNPSLRKQMGHKSRQLIEAHDIRKTIAAYEELYLSLKR